MQAAKRNKPSEDDTQLDVAQLLREPVTTTDRVLELPLDALIKGKFDPRVRPITRKEVEDLMASIEANGQTAPITVRPAPEEGEGKYYVEGGNRRCAALRFLGRDKVRAILEKEGRTEKERRATKRRKTAKRTEAEKQTRPRKRSGRGSSSQRVIGWSSGRVTSSGF